MADRRENDPPESQDATIGAICRQYAAAVLSGDEVAAEVAIREERPAAGFVLGGRAISSRLRSRPGIAICDRVSDVVEAVDAMAKRADTN
jgi:hypothetical protein